MTYVSVKPYTHQNMGRTEERASIEVQPDGDDLCPGLPLQQPGTLFSEEDGTLWKILSATTVQQRDPWGASREPYRPHQYSWLYEAAKAD